MTAALSADPAVSRHRLGTRLRELRQEHCMRLDTAAAALGVVPSTLSRIETGKAPARAGYVRILLDLYQVDDPAERQDLAGLAAHGRRDNWCAAAADLLAPEAMRYLGLETAATQIRLFAATVIPGLLQTPDYAMAAWQAARPGLTATQADRLAGLTCHRQQTRTGRTLHAVIDEAALLRPPGTPALMAAQLAHLARAAGDSSVTVQILPLAVPWPVLSPPFTLLTFGPADPDAACVPGPAGRPALITAVRAVGVRAAAFAALAAAALPPDESAALITRLAGHPRPAPD